MFSRWAELGLLALGVGSFGVALSAGTLLLRRFEAATGGEPQTRSEAIWGWVKAAIFGVPVVVAVFAGVPLAYVFGLAGLLVVFLAAIDVIIGRRAARQLDGESGQPKLRSLQTRRRTTAPRPKRRGPSSARRVIERRLVRRAPLPALPPNPLTIPSPKRPDGKRDSESRPGQTVGGPSTSTSTRAPSFSVL